MKNIFFSLLCLGMLLLVGCNDEGKSEKTDKDSTTISGITDPAFDKMRSFFAKGFTNFDPDATLDNIDFYPDLKGKTEYVKYNYKDFKFFIDSLNTSFGDTAKAIYLVYGAFTKKDAERYIQNHEARPSLEIKEIKNQPTLLVGYKNPDHDYLIYNDIATICPPPRSCSTFFMFPENMKTFIGKAASDFDPDLTIANYNSIYNHPDPRLYSLTASVKFDIKAIKYLVDSLDKLYAPASEIYFALGAYTAADADRYIKTHPGTKKEEIIDRTCLLFAYKVQNVEGFKYFDIGTLCTPPGFCQSDFNYGN